MRGAAGIWARADARPAAVAANAAIDVMTCRRDKPQEQLRPAVSVHANALRLACRMDASSLPFCAGPCFGPCGLAQELLTPFSMRRSGMSHIKASKTKAAQESQ